MKRYRIRPIPHERVWSWWPARDLMRDARMKARNARALKWCFHTPLRDQLGEKSYRAYLATLHSPKKRHIVRFLRRRDAQL